jgi:Protein of unknown function (DUF3168)
MSFDAFDAKKELLQALESNKTLVSLVPGGFHNLKASNAAVFPRVVYTELHNADDSFADNEAISADIRFQISIFNQEENISSQTLIAKEIDKTMKALGYARYDSIDMYEEEERIYHKAMRYQKISYIGG